MADESQPLRRLDDNPRGTTKATRRCVLLRPRDDQDRPPGGWSTAATQRHGLTRQMERSRAKIATMGRHLTVDEIEQLRHIFTDIGYVTDPVMAAIGDSGQLGLTRNSTTPALRALAGRTDALAELFVYGCCSSPFPLNSWHRCRCKPSLRPASSALRDQQLAPWSMCVPTGPPTTALRGGQFPTSPRAWIRPSLKSALTTY